MMKNIMRRKEIICCVIMSLCLCLLCSCSKQFNIVGEWKIDSYQIDDMSLSKDQIGEYCGEDFAVNNNDNTIVFFENGVVEITMGDYRGGHDAKIGSYYLSDNRILVGEEGAWETLLIKDNAVIWDDGMIQHIYKKR